jgi:hypothetical protein
MASENCQMVERASQIFLILGGIELTMDGWHCGEGRLTERASDGLGTKTKMTKRPAKRAAIIFFISLTFIYLSEIYFNDLMIGILVSVPKIYRTGAAHKIAKEC